MKYNDTGDFCVLYVEPMDDKTALFTTIIGQRKPVVLMLAEQTRVLQRPEDFAELKHVKRQLDQPIAFVAAQSERLLQLAHRNGFPVYPSMDALADALAKGHMTRQRTRATTMPLNPAQVASLSNKTTPLTPPPPNVHTTDTLFPAQNVPTTNTLFPAQNAPTTNTLPPSPFTFHTTEPIRTAEPPLRQPTRPMQGGREHGGE